jgi:hypothetical protein
MCLDSPPESATLPPAITPEPILDVERAAILSGLHGLLDTVYSCDDLLLVVPHFTHFVEEFGKLGRTPDTDLVNHILLLLASSPPEFCQMRFLPLLITMVSHWNLAELFISSDALHYLTHEGYWAETLPIAKTRIHELVRLVLREGEGVIAYLSGIGFSDVLFRQYEITRTWRPSDASTFLLMQQLMGAAQRFARFPHLLSPSDHAQLFAIANDVIVCCEVFPHTVSEALTILRLFVESPDFALDLIGNSGVLSLVLNLFTEKYHDHWESAFNFLRACAHRPEFIEFLTSFDVIAFTEHMMPALEQTQSLAGFCSLLSDFLTMNPEPIATFMHGGFFDCFLPLLDGATFNVKCEFTELLVLIVSFANFDDLAALMSDRVANFFFDLLETSSVTAVRFLQALVQLSDRGVKFEMSDVVFVVRLDNFIQDFPDDLSELIEGLGLEREV